MGTHTQLKSKFAVGDARSRKKVCLRGRIAKPLDCRDDGQWARLQAVALSMSKPDAYDVRMEHEVKKIDQRACLDRAPRSPTIIRFLRRIFKIGAGTSRAAPLLKWVADYRYVLQIQKSGGCSDAAQDAVLWGVGTVVVKWERQCVRWYDAAQKHAATHLDVNVRTSTELLSCDCLHASDIEVGCPIGAIVFLVTVAHQVAAPIAVAVVVAVIDPARRAAVAVI